MSKNKDQASAVWRKSSYSNAERNCVEVCDLGEGAQAMRDSKHPELGVLAFGAAEWRAFLGDAQGL